MTIEEQLKQELQLLAATDWNKFVAITQLDVSSLEICKRRKKGQSLQQIANAMQMPRSTVGKKSLQYCPDC